ncbi:hypothetical protein NQD34_012452 [Periophthalmus magnuspinnatus]|nr:hypothetical protein NQD34_012452 [Periophthalmus magnuspinnatus]
MGLFKYVTVITVMCLCRPRRRPIRCTKNAVHSDTSFNMIFMAKKNKSLGELFPVLKGIKGLYVIYFCLLLREKILPAFNSFIKAAGVQINRAADVQLKYWD